MQNSKMADFFFRLYICNMGFSKKKELNFDEYLASLLVHNAAVVRYNTSRRGVVILVKDSIAHL